MSFALALAIAASFWTGHGVNTPCHPQPVATSNAQFTAWQMPGAYSAAYPWPAACNIYLSTAALIERRTAPAGFCAGVVHETGNIDGVPESTPGLPITDTFFSTPAVCWSWRAWRRAHWGY